MDIFANFVKFLLAPKKNRGILRILTRFNEKF